MQPDRETRFIDPNIARKGTILDQHLAKGSQGNPPPFFSLIEFNLSGLCNRTCAFCPRSDPKVYPNVNEHIPVELYEKIMADLQEARFDGTILYSAFGEPLLYKRIELLIEISKRYCPDVRVEIVSDGDFVTPDKLRKLFGAGLTVLSISMYDGPHQQEEFEAMRKEVGLAKEQLILRVRWLAPDQQYGITLSNRAGMVALEDLGIGALKEPLQKPCYYPFYQILVDYDGSVLLCPHDWGKKLIAGNLNRQSIMEVWDSRIMRRVRTNLARADRNFPPCDVCDVDGTRMGRGHFDRWMNYYQGQKKVER